MFNELFTKYPLLGVFNQILAPAAAMLSLDTRVQSKDLITQAKDTRAKSTDLITQAKDTRAKSTDLITQAKDTNVQTTDKILTFNL